MESDGANTTSGESYLKNGRKNRAGEDVKTLVACGFTILFIN